MTDPDDGPARVRISLRPRRAPPRDVRVPAGVTAVRRGQLERHRHRLHLRRSRHLPQVQGAGPRRRRCRSPGWTRARSTPTSCAPAGGWPAWRPADAGRPGARCRRWSPGPRRPPSASGGRSSCGPRCRSGTWSWPSRRWPTSAPTRSGCWDALDDLELRADLHVLRRLPRVLRAADFKVTAVVVDDVLIDVEPGDTTGRRFGIAFDLGTTTVVATLLDLSTGTPVAVGVDAQPAAALRRRRDHPDQRDDDGPGRAGPADRAGPPGAAPAGRRGLRRRRRRAAPRSTRSRWPATRR